MFTDFISKILFYFEAGGFVMPPLALITILLWYMLGYRFHVLKRGNKRSVRALLEKYKQGYDKKPSGIIDDAIVKALEVSKVKRDDLRAYLDVLFFEHKKEITKYSKTIRILVAVAPLAGLLGTVTGMIETFDSLGNMSLFSQSGGIAGGISQALFTTQMGLVVAVPGLIIGKMLDRKEHNLERELNQITDLVCSMKENSRN
ncbi:MAG: biopolymer transport protein ExbB [Campylobacterota bacterium]|nr:biopolymer transport protein ExbB [Campylobacterota bacterium]